MTNIISVRVPRIVIENVDVSITAITVLALAVSSSVRYPFVCLYCISLSCLKKGVELLTHLRVVVVAFFTEPSTAYKAGRTLRNQIKELRLSGANDWRDQAIVLIRKSRQKSPSAELERLRGASILDKKSEASLDAAISQVNGTFSYIYKRTRVQNIKMIYAQAMEIKKVYGDEYDVFLHAQASPWLANSYFVKELWRLHNPEIDFHHFKSLRAPCSTAKAGSLENIYQFLSFFRGIEKYRDRYFQLLTLSDSDHKVREELLSADAYFFNYSAYESSLYFLSHNSNILENKDVIKSVTKQTIEHFYPEISPKKSAIYANKILHTAEFKNAVCGNLFVICVPKDKAASIQYRAHPFGRACQCHPKKEDRKILEKLENGVLDESTKCNTIFGPPVPQFRLYLPAIQPERDIHIFLLSPLAKDKKHKMKSKIKSIVAQQHSSLVNTNRTT